MPWKCSTWTKLSPAAAPSTTWLLWPVGRGHLHKTLLKLDQLHQSNSIDWLYHSHPLFICQIGNLFWNLINFCLFWNNEQVQSLFECGCVWKLHWNVLFKLKTLAVVGWLVQFLFLITNSPISSKICEEYLNSKMFYQGEQGQTRIAAILQQFLLQKQWNSLSPLKKIS